MPEHPTCYILMVLFFLLFLYHGKHSSNHKEYNNAEKPYKNAFVVTESIYLFIVHIRSYFTEAFLTQVVAYKLTDYQTKYISYRYDVGKKNFIHHNEHDNKSPKVCVVIVSSPLKYIVATKVLF